jgi:AhpD family alkylhydroperoxidase
MPADASFHAITRRISTDLAGLRGNVPDTLKAFGDLGAAALQPGVLDAKTKELIALALGVAAHCDPCIAYHAKALVKLGATRQEVAETLAVNVYMGGGPSAMYSANAVEAFEEFARQAAPVAA